jgi:2-octaprenylphenol hydroxylase
MMHNRDVVVVGGGLVGASCAVALAKQGLRVGLLERRTVSPAEISADPLLDSRIYAITPSNAAWLDALGVWQKIDPQRVGVIADMEIWGDRDAESGTSATLKFSAYGTGLAQLAFVLEEKVLLAALWVALTETHVEVLAGEVANLVLDQEAATLSLTDGTQLQARLVVAADGANSTVRSLAGISAHTHAYGQEGVVANFETERPHQNIARQWFRRDGVMAWLPLAGNLISLVWSTSDFEPLLKLKAEELADRVAEAGGQRLGAMKTVTPARGFPLDMRIADVMARPRLVLMGDAAHRIHPMAGQGVNLGFGDAIELARILVERKRQQDPGDHMLLRRYERARRTGLLEMQLVTHGLNWMFEKEWPALKALRNWGMHALDRQSLLKRQLIRQAV